MSSPREREVVVVLGITVAFVSLAAVGGAVSALAADSQGQALEGVSAERADGSGCHLSMSVDPTALEGYDRVVVEAGEGNVVTGPTRLGTWARPGSNVTIYAVDTGGQHTTDVLLSGRLGPYCDLLRDGGAA